MCMFSTSARLCYYPFWHYPMTLKPHLCIIMNGKVSRGIIIGLPWPIVNDHKWVGINDTYHYNYSTSTYYGDDMCLTMIKISSLPIMIHNNSLVKSIMDIPHSIE